MVIDTSIIPATTRPQLATIERKISRASGRCLRAMNSSVSCSERRMMNSTGTIRQPTKKGMRQ
ncbi:hypothetical protein D3C84_1152660 [compost metagenome]